MLMLRNTIARGKRSGYATIFGMCLGCMVHGTLSALGLSLILMQSAEVYSAVKWLGAAYLIYLGAKSLVGMWRERSRRSDSADSRLYSRGVAVAQRGSQRKSFLEGLLTNILNPKVAIFYLAFLPQFIRPGEPILAKSLLLSGIHSMEGIIWMSFLVYSITRAKHFITRPLVKQWLSGLSAAALLFFGFRLALEKVR